MCGFTLEEKVKLLRPINPFFLEVHLKSVCTESGVFRKPTLQQFWKWNQMKCRINQHLPPFSWYFCTLFSKAVLQKRFGSLDLNPIIDFVMSDSCIHCWCPDDVKRLTSKTDKYKTEFALISCASEASYHAYTTTTTSSLKIQAGLLTRRPANSRTC